MAQRYEAIDTQDFEKRIQQMEDRLLLLEGYLPGYEDGAVSARQWQSALATQTRLDEVRDALPADYYDPVTLQWFAAGVIRPIVSDPVWSFTKTKLAYTDLQMQALYDLALTKDA